MSFSKLQRESFDTIERIIKVIDGEFVDFEKNIKILAKEEVELRAVLAFEENYTVAEIGYVKSLIYKVEYLLEPVFERITDSAFKHFNTWFKEINSEDERPIKLTATQMKMVYWILYKLIRKKSLEDIYTVVMPRGMGKSFIIASIAVFLMYNHDTYCINKKDSKYTILITSPSDNNLAQFLSYIRDFVTRSNRRIDSGIELARINDEMIRLKKDSIMFAEVFFRLAGRNSKNIEGIHADLLLADEFKMVDKPSWDTSILPCLNGKGGIPFCISSTDEYYTFFQELCETNIRLKKLDGEIRHFQGDLNKLVKERAEYALTVSRAKKQLGEHSISFRTQYKCEFIGKRKQGFFDIDALYDFGIFRLPFNDMRFVHNPKYVIVAGWDFAPINDNSLLTIKAIEEGYGQIRKTHFITQIVLNQERNVQINDIRSQIRDAIMYIKRYNIQALCLDSGGAGSNLKNLIVEELLEREDIEIDFNMITEVKFSYQNRVDILDIYSNRINSGLEVFFEIENELIEIDYLKKYYNNTINNFEEDAEIIRFLYEHCRFKREEEIMTDGKVKIIFKQSNEYKLKDDTVFGSALATHNLTLFPNLSYIESNISIADFFNKGKNDNTFRYR